MEIKRKYSGDGNMNRMELRTYEDAGVEIPVLQFPALEETGLVEHLFTTRRGGVSSGIYESMNLSFTRGDDRTLVVENFNRIAHIFGTDTEHVVATCQKHHTNVARVTSKDGGNGITRPNQWDDMDGIITNEPGVVLGTFFADCVPLLFVDPVHRAIGACHSGWRGTVARIGEVMVRRMQEEFGTDPADLICGIGPSICADCYEVSEDVAQEFRREFAGHEDEILRAGRPGHAQLDLWAACRIGLEDAGVLREHISTTDICTCCNHDWMFSHRASNGQHGNFGGFIMLRP